MAKRKSKQQQKSIDVRRFINDELERQGRSKYWLGKAVKDMGGANRETILRYLRGDRDTTGGVIGVILTALGVTLTVPAAGAEPAEHRPATATKRAR